MGQRLIFGHEEIPDGQECVVLYCSTTGWAFGPVVSADNGRSAEDRMQAFLDWNQRTHHETDLRALSDGDLESRWQTWSTSIEPTE